jgi:hypothetical protein
MPVVPTLVVKQLKSNRFMAENSYDHWPRRGFSNDKFLHDFQRLFTMDRSEPLLVHGQRPWV